MDKSGSPGRLYLDDLHVGQRFTSATYAIDDVDHSLKRLATPCAPPVCTENPIRVEDLTESPKLAE